MGVLANSSQTQIGCCLATRTTTVLNLLFFALCFLVAPDAIRAAKIHETQVGDVVHIKCHEYTIQRRLGYGHVSVCIVNIQQTFK